MTARALFILVGATAAVLAVQPNPGSSRVDGHLRATIECGTPPASRTAVGSIQSVVTAEASVDSSFAYGGRTLYAGSTVCTNSTGQLKYRLTKDGVTYCNSGTPPNSSRASLYPSADVAVSWSLGSTWCVGTGVHVTLSSIGKLSMRATNPLFGVFVDKKRGTTARVVSGFLEVSGPGSGKPLIVGPGQQVAVRAQGDPSAVVPIVLSGGDRATIADLQFQVPPTKFVRPAVDSSKVLKKIFDTRSFAIGLDRGTSAFARAYFGGLAKSWRVAAKYRAVSGTTALEQLKHGTIAVAVVPASLAVPSTLEATPFLTGADGSAWKFVLIGDKTYDAAMRTYLLTALDTGRYASAYRATYTNHEPGYSLLRPLLFPS